MTSIDIPTDVAFKRGGKYGDELCFRHAVLAVMNAEQGEAITAYLESWTSPCVECSREKEQS
jgi:hypothetical protein